MSKPVRGDDTAKREFGDMQCLIRFGNGHLSEACFLLLQVRDASAARSWLQTVPVTNAEKKNPRPDHTFQIAFTAAGLQALEISESIIEGFSDEFIVGMTGDVNRSRRLGDTGTNDPVNWEWGHPEQPHVLLMLYAQENGLQTCISDIEKDEFTAAFSISKRLLTGAPGPNEPFGFADGISQPTIDWQDQLSTDLHERASYTNQLKVGEILLGYENEYGLYTDRPLLDHATVPHADILPLAEDSPTHRDLGRNGCYLVMRQLEQDVPGFWQFLDQLTADNEHEREQLASAMVGRKRDGTPLINHRGNSDQTVEQDDITANNRFSFDEDPYGQECPIGAHIRRANPRTGDLPPGTTGWLSRLLRTLGFGRRHANEDLISSTRFHRLLRRGRAYGPTLSPADAINANADTNQRGLHFVCIGANILRQFEFVQNAWLMNSKFAGLAGESDPLLGNREPLLSGEATDQFSLPQADAPAQRHASLPQFVTVRGGAYFFMPGLKALQFISTHPEDNQ